MRAEQMSVDKIKVTLETDLEKSTIGECDRLSVVIERTDTIGFRQLLPIEIEVRKEDQP